MCTLLEWVDEQSSTARAEELRIIILKVMIIENVKLRHAVLHARTWGPSPEDRACRQTSPLYLCVTKTLQEQWKVTWVKQYYCDKKHRKQNVVVFFKFVWDCEFDCALSVFQPVNQQMFHSSTAELLMSF